MIKINNHSIDILLLNASVFFIAFFLAFAPVIPGAINALSAIIALIALAIGWSGLKESNEYLKYLLSGFIFYLLSAVLSLVNNNNWPDAGWRFERYYPFLLAIPITGLFARLGFRLIKPIFFSLSISAILMAVVSAYQQILMDIERVGVGTGFNPNTFGHLASLISLIMAGLITLGDLNIKARLISLLAFCSSSYAMLATGSRGSIIAFIAGLSVILFYGLKYCYPSRKMGLIVSSLIIFFVILISASHKMEFWLAHWHKLAPEIDAFFKGDYSYTSTAVRISMWQAGIMIGLEHPLIGTGIGDTEHDFVLLRETGQIPYVEDGVTQILHSIYIDCFASTGLIGLLTMLLSIFIIPSLIFKKSLKVDLVPWPISNVVSVIGKSMIANLAFFGATNSWLYLRGLPFIIVTYLLLIIFSLQGNDYFTQ